MNSSSLTVHSSSSLAMTTEAVLSPVHVTDVYFRLQQLHRTKAAALRLISAQRPLQHPTSTSPPHPPPPPPSCSAHPPPSPRPCPPPCALISPPPGPRCLPSPPSSISGPL